MTFVRHSLTRLFLLTSLVACTQAPVKASHPVHTIPATPEQISGKTDEAPSTPLVLAPTPEASSISANIKNEDRKIGVVLGPGGLKTFSYIGVLREFEKAGIDVYAMVGLEWGSVVGAAYSMQGRANDAEWKLSKIKRQDLPKEMSYDAKDPEDIVTLDPFLKSVFENRRFEDMKVQFSCLSYFSAKDKVVQISAGSVQGAMNMCLPYPPFYKIHRGSIAAPFAVDEAVRILKQRGANTLILLNVIGLGVAPKSDLLWNEMRRVLQSHRDEFDFVVDIPTKGYALQDVDSLRELLTIGQKAGAAATKNILEKLK